MTKEEAIIYIKKYAEPHDLTWECMQCFEADIIACEDRDPNYGQLAWDALYEWDI